MRALFPVALSNYLGWKRRFGALGLGPSMAAKAARSRSLRSAVSASRIEHLPPTARVKLSLVVDVGTNTGQWISALMTFVEVDRVEAFEPNPEAFEILSARFGDRPNFHLHQLALGEGSDKLILNVTRASDLASILVPGVILRETYSPGKADVIQRVPVTVASLDSMIAADVTVDLLKIDVQGFEGPVLRGAKKTFRRTRVLLIETNFVSHYDGDDNFASLYAYICGELGFEFWDMAPPYRTGPDRRSLWTDAIFVNPAMSS